VLQQVKALARTQLTADTVVVHDRDVVDLIVVVAQVAAGLVVVDRESDAAQLLNQQGLLIVNDHDAAALDKALASE
jgi:hypothetical protein